MKYISLLDCEYNYVKLAMFRLLSGQKLYNFALKPMVLLN